MSLLITPNIINAFQDGWNQRDLEGNLHPGDRTQAGLAAALPYLEKQLRSLVALEIENTRDTTVYADSVVFDDGFFKGMSMAARIAGGRGLQ